MNRDKGVRKKCWLIAYQLIVFKLQLSIAISILKSFVKRYKDKPGK